MSLTRAIANWYRGSYKGHGRRPGPLVKQLNHCYKYNSEDNDWVPISTSIQDENPSPAPESIRFATLNVLHNHSIHERFLRANERYTHTEKLITRLNADVVALQEVTATMVAVLMRSPFVQQNYYISDVLRDCDWQDAKKYIPYYAATQNNLTGNILLSRFPMSEMYQLDTSHRHPVCGVVQLGGERELLVVGFHPKAMEHDAEHRVSETYNTMQAIANHRRLSQVRDCIVLGDLNVHSPSEDANLFEPHNLIDLWTVNRAEGSDPGYTFDAKKNTFISRYIPFENRQMRLDRITIRRDSALSLKDQVQLWANEAVNSNGDWLFVSDHFGLWADFSLE